MDKIGKQLTVDPHTLSGEKEKYLLYFDHYITESINQKRENILRINIQLKAFKKGRVPSMNENLTIGTASFIPGHKPDIIVLTTHPDSGDFVEAILNAGLAKYIGRKTERFQDFPDDEIEEFVYQKLDVTDFYNNYMKEGQNRVQESPVTHISLCEKDEDTFYNNQLYVKCRIGGIIQERVWGGRSGRVYMQIAELYPESKFQLKEYVMNLYEKQLQLYNSAKERITDVKILFNKGEHYLRCKIDGIQQLAKKINRLDICDYQRSKDVHALTSKYFSRELDDGREKNISRFR